MANAIRALTRSRPPKPIGSFLLTAVGLAAAFGAASCCALPVLLASAGVGSAWLFGVAIFAGPNRSLLIWLALGLLALALVLLVRQHRRAAACRTDGRSGMTAAEALVALGLLATAVLTGLALVIE